MACEVRRTDLEPDAAEDLQRTLTETLLAERERTAFLAEASRTLAGLLNEDRTTSRVLGLAVPRLAAWCAVALWSGAGVRLTSSTGATASIRGRKLDEEGGGRRGLARALRNGRLVRLDTVSDADLHALLPDDVIRADGVAARPCAALAVPLRGRGELIGALILLRSSNDFDDAEVPVCEDFAQRAAVALEAARLYAERSHTARVLEAALRPRALPEATGLRLGSYYRPMSNREIGGDFFDVHGGGSDWSLVIGDVSGSGVEAAVLTGQARHALRTAGLVDRSPGRMLELANTVLVEGGSSRFVTILCCRLQLHGGGGARLDVASAGHPPPLVRRGDGSVEVPEARGMAAGIMGDRRYPEVGVDLEAGDLCLLYTDGVTEARSRAGALFGEDRLRCLVAETPPGEPQAAIDYVAQAVLEHLGGSAHDDVALLAAGTEP